MCRLFPQQQGQSAAPEEGALTQILSSEPLQRENFSALSPSSVSCPPQTPPTTPCTFFVLSLQPHIHLATFIILSSSDHFSPPLSLLLFLLHLSLALTRLQHCSVGGDASTNYILFFLPTCKVFNPKAFSSCGESTVKPFFFFYMTHTRIHLWSS